MPTDDAAPKGLIFELSALYDYGYCQTYVLLIFFGKRVFGSVDIKMIVFYF